MLAAPRALHPENINTGGDAGKPCSSQQRDRSLRNEATYLFLCVQRDGRGPAGCPYRDVPSTVKVPTTTLAACCLGLGCIGHVELIDMLCSTAGLRTGHQLGVAVPPVDTPCCQAEKGQCPTRGRVPSASCYGPGHCMPSPESPRAAPMKDGNPPPSSHAVALAHQVVSK